MSESISTAATSTAATSTSTSTATSDHIRKELDDAIGQYVEEPWDMIGSYFETSHLEKLVRHQLESYNDLVYNQLELSLIHI